MKNLNKLMFIFICVIFVNCNNDNNNLDKINENQVQLPDVIKLLENKQYNSKGNFDFYFTTESDFVSGSNGCFTVNVRVYIHSTVYNTKTLLVNENVKVGDCGQNKNDSNSTKNKCESFSLKNGDKFLSNGTESPYCMNQLIKYDVIYDNYIESMKSLEENK